MACAAIRVYKGGHTFKGTKNHISKGIREGTESLESILMYTGLMVHKLHVTASSKIILL